MNTNQAKIEPQSSLHAILFFIEKQSIDWLKCNGKNVTLPTTSQMNMQ